jgi:hypothetical protein
LTGVWQSTFVLLVGVLFLVAVLVVAIGGIWRFFLRRGAEPTAEWLEEFDFTRYRGLAQLFDPRDFDFLRSQPGYVPELSARLKADRLAIAASYLRQLETDMRLLLNLLNRTSRDLRPGQEDFSAFLLKQEFKFAISLFRLRVELTLMKFGLVQQIKFEEFLEGLRPLVQYSQRLALQP